MWSGKADVADFSSLSCGDSGFESAARGKDAVGIFHPDDLVKLDEVDSIGLEAAKRFFELLVICLFRSAIHFGHEKNLVSVAIAERLPHADFADAAVIVPAVIHEGDAAVDGLTNEVNAFVGIGLLANMVSAKTDSRDLFTGPAEFTVDHVGRLRSGNGARRFSGGTGLSEAAAAGSGNSDGCC